MEICCSFKSFAGGTCGFSSREDRVVPLVSCKKDISSHLRSCKFSGPENEVDLILLRAGFFETPKNIDEFTICPTHRSHLGVGWSRGSNSRCRVPKEVFGHGKGSKLIPKANRGVNKRVSQMVLKMSGKFIQPGSGKWATALFPLATGRRYIYIYKT